MMNPYLKIKTWYENKLFWYRVKRGLSKKAKKQFYKYSLSYKTISVVIVFWLAHWQFIIKTSLTIIGIIIGIVLFILK